LSAADKRSRDPGDSAAMIAARHRFLEAGHYRCLADSVGDMLMPYLVPDSVIVDAGCGEGYYLASLRERLIATGQSQPVLVGFDISKPAMQTAARRFAATWLVASNRNVPLMDASVDIVIDMFGFPDFRSFARILKPSGVLLRVQAGENHLLELRQIIYPTLKQRDQSLTTPEGFARQDKRQLVFELRDLCRETLADVLLMTPHLFRATAEGKQRVAALESLSLSADVFIELFTRV
ncbi:MAG: methyltransferase domain-containing protein, partial [Congregibacter sp.]|nr:methyltransferase domain-containing protein [Congregibacter sp.]